MNADEKKKAAAAAALEFVEADMVVGVGTGSTANHFIDLLAKVKGKIDGAVASSQATEVRLKQIGIPVLDANAAGDLPLYVDGADEATEHRHLIKGGGGALTREKIVAATAERFVCIVDDSKLVGRLGKFPLPVEVIPMARSYVARQIVLLGGQPAWRQGFITDNGNVILDIHNLDILNPVELETCWLLGIVACERLSSAQQRGARHLMNPTLTFHGATQEVTGSCYLIDTGANRVLLECGMFQGSNETERQNEQPFPFDPTAIQAVVLSHAHLDHSGRLPKLVRDGFRGSIFCTPPTRDLLEIILMDAAFLHARDIEWENRRRTRSGRELLTPLFTEDDVAQALSQCRTQEYDQRFRAASDVEVCFRDAGHIIGSAIVELWAGGRKLAFSGDLGNKNSLLLHDPATVHAADALLLESTYGDRDHRSLKATLDEFEEILATAGGNVIIPAFAVERTQEVLYFLGDLYEAGKLKQQRIFLDSPMAIAATEVYRKYESLLNGKIPGTRAHAGKHQVLPPLQYSRTTEESMAINRITGGAIIIAGSGMCTGGRVRHHLKYNLWRNEAQVVIVGFQARGTLGRALVDGAKTVRLLGEDIVVRAKIHTLGGFSAHAGQSQLIEWAGGFRERQPHIYLVHGEPEKMTTLQAALRQQLGAKVDIAAAGETMPI